MGWRGTYLTPCKRSSIRVGGAGELHAAAWIDEIDVFARQVL